MLHHLVLLLPIYTILWVEVTISEEGNCWLQGFFLLFSDETPAKTIDLHACKDIFLCIHTKPAKHMESLKITDVAF